MYADEALTGTRDTRPEFQRLLTDCRAGKIDIVIAKSITRFARNTVDTLVTVRTLKEKGVEIYFEKENIYTLDAKGEVLITIVSSLAQEEISENVTWGQRQGTVERQHGGVGDCRQGRRLHLSVPGRVGDSDTGRQIAPIYMKKFKIQGMFQSARITTFLPALLAAYRAVSASETRSSKEGCFVLSYIATPMLIVTWNVPFLDWKEHIAMRFRILSASSKATSTPAVGRSAQNSSPP